MQPINTEHIKEEKKVPDLRFPEFDSGWFRVKLGEVVKFKNGKAHEQDIDENGKFIVVNSKFISTNGQVKKYSNQIICTLQESEIVMVMSDVPKGKALAKCYYIQKSDQYTLNQRICGLFSNEHCNKFLFYRINRNPYYLKFDSGVGQTNLRKEEVLKCPFYIPLSKPEQQKIASFLSAVDQKIQQLTRKKELLEQYKKGVMQKIFSREIRFRDENGNDFPDWEEKQLGDILTFISTNSLSRNDLNYDSGEIKNIHYGDIHTTFKMGFDVEKEKVPFINKEVDLRNISKDQFCQVGDIVVADASEDYSDIGKAIEVLNVGNERIVSGLHTFLARDTTGQTIKGFKGYLFQTWQIRKQIMKVAQGISVLGISKKNLAKVEFLLPCREEQGKITTLLKNIDKRIANTLTQITQTQKFKKGLLQQMFV